MNYAPWKAKNQDEFLYEAFNFYRVKTGGYIFNYKYFPAHIEGAIFWLYKLGRDYRVLFMDCEEFTRLLLDKHKNYRRGKAKSYFSHWYGYFGEYRVLKGFTYTGQSKKDSPSKNEWRDKKRFYSDSSKSNYRNNWKKSFKHYNKRKHRRIEKRAIYNETYDKLHMWSYKQAEDPWGWD